MKLLGILLAVAGLLAACKSGGEVAAVPPGGTYYTQFTLQYEKDLFRTTNYRRGLVLPINSEVTLRSMDSAEIVVDIKASGRQLTVENVPKHTGETTKQAFDKLFGKSPVDLSKFTKQEREGILSGRAAVGMSREAVLAALGPPPAVGTPTLAANPWKYWNSRFTTFAVRFDDTWHVVEAGR
jgi:hypothetical protein